MVIEERRTNSVVKALVEPVIALAAELERVPVRAEVVLQAVARALAIVPVAAELELGIVPVAAVPALGIVPVAAAPELEIVPVAAELGLARAVAELERGPEAGEPVPNQPHAHLAVPLRIKSVTGPRRHDQVLLLTVEDLAVEVVETTHGQAAAEAGIAWAAAE
jgi:hypothetical protein